MDLSVKKQGRRMTFLYSVIQGLYYSSYASLFAYLVVFLTGRGLSPSQIGVITALRVAAALVSSFSLAHLADTRDGLSLKYLFMGVSAAGLAFCLLLPLSRTSVVFTALLLLAMGGTYCALDAILSGLALQFFNAGVPVNYSIGRSVGSAAYAVVCIFSGRMIDRFGTEVVIILCAAAIGLTILATAFFPRFVQPERDTPLLQKRRHAGDPFALLKENRLFRLLILSNVVLTFGYIPISNFLSSFLANAGADNSTIGLALFIAAFSEMPMMAFIFPRLMSRKVPVERLLFASSVFHLIRYLSYAFLTEAWMLVAVQVLQMVSYGMAVPAAVYYINGAVSKENRMTGQTVYQFSGNMGSTLGNPVFGVVLDHLGPRAMVFGGSAFILLSLIPMGMLIAHPQRRR